MSCQEDMEAMVLEIHHLLAVFGGASLKRTVMVHATMIILLDPM
ncbi:hypothetical protein Hanom_Chr12g01116771 [Helianthus anomalus]